MTILFQQKAYPFVYNVQCILTGFKSHSERARGENLYLAVITLFNVFLLQDMVEQWTMQIE